MTEEIGFTEKIEQLRALVGQLQWERDIAISQLEDIGVQFGEKVDDVVRVVRCEDCMYSEESLRNDSVWCMRRAYDDSDIRNELVDVAHFCSYGERK